MKPATPDFLRLHFIVILFGFTGILGKLISIPAVEMVFFRTLFAAVGMAVFILLTGRSLKVSPRDGIALVLTGAIVALHWVAFFLSGRIANVSVSLVGFATASFWTALLEPLFNRSRLNWFEVLLGLFVLAGLWIIFGSDFHYSIGLWIGIGSGLTCAIFALINAKLVRRIEPSAITFYEMAGATLSIACFFPLYQAQWAEGQQLRLVPTGTDWLWILVLAWLCTVYAYSASVELFKRISVFLFQLTLNLEPVYGILMALVVFGEAERMNRSFYLGSFVIFCAVIVYPFIKGRLQPARPSGQ
ncbi:MAG: DMT family transporter [Cyclobacteriaceae bacterium]|nr:DMT family transporter [Cyclobacteriaceae bacterium]